MMMRFYDTGMDADGHQSVVEHLQWTAHTTLGLILEET